LKLSYAFCHFAHTDHQKACGERIERASMPNFESLSARSAYQVIPQLIDHIKRCPTQWFVDHNHGAVYQLLGVLEAIWFKMHGAKKHK